MRRHWGEFCRCLTPVEEGSSEALAGSAGCALCFWLQHCLAKMTWSKFVALTVSLESKSHPGLLILLSLPLGINSKVSEEEHSFLPAALLWAVFSGLWLGKCKGQNGSFPVYLFLLVNLSLLPPILLEFRKPMGQTFSWSKLSQLCWFQQCVIFHQWKICPVSWND